MISFLEFLVEQERTPEQATKLLNYTTRRTNRFNIRHTNINTDPTLKSRAYGKKASKPTQQMLDPRKLTATQPTAGYNYTHEFIHGRGRGANDPIRVVKKNNQYNIVDGHHRVMAARLRRQRQIAALVHEDKDDDREDWIRHGRPALRHPETGHTVIGKRTNIHWDLLNKHRRRKDIDEYQRGFWNKRTKKFADENDCPIHCSDQIKTPKEFKVSMRRWEIDDVKSGYRMQRLSKLKRKLARLKEGYADYKQSEDPDHPAHPKHHLHDLWQHGTAAYQHNTTGQVKWVGRGQTHEDVKKKIREPDALSFHKNWSRGFLHTRTGKFHPDPRNRLDATDYMSELQKRSWLEKQKQKLHAPGIWEAIGNWDDENPEDREDLIKHGLPAFRHRKEGWIHKGKRGETHGDLRNQLAGFDPEVRQNMYHTIERGFWHKRKKEFISGNKTTIDTPDLMTTHQRMKRFGRPDLGWLPKRKLDEAGMKSGYENNPMWPHVHPALKHRETGEVIHGRRGWDTHDDLIDKVGSHPQTISDLMKSRHGNWEQGYWHKKEKRFVPHREAGFDSTDLMSPAQQRMRGIMG